VHPRNAIPESIPVDDHSPSDDMSAPEVIDRYASVIGGHEAIAAQRTTHLRANVTAMGLSGVSETWRVSPDRTRENMDLGPYELVECCDGTTAWRIGLDGKLAMVDGRELEDARAGAWFDNTAWLTPALGGETVTRLGTREDSTGLSVVIEVTPPTGYARELWFDASSGLLTRMVETRAQPEITTEFSDYRAEDGVLVAHRIVKSLAGMPANTLTMLIDAVRTNVVVPSELFVPPRMAAASIRWLETAGSARIPFRYSMNHIWVTVSVNGAPAAEFILDSGASISVIDSAYAASIGLATIGRAEAQGAGAVGQASFARLESLRIGGDAADGVELADRPIGVLPIDASISPALWRNVAGLLGADFMRDFVVDVDFDHQLLTLSDPSSFRYDGSGSPVSFTLAQGIPVVPLTIDGRHRGNFRVDLGAGGGAVLQPSFVERAGIAVAGGIGGSSGGFGGRFPKQYLRMKSVELGPLEWAAPIVGVVRAHTGVLAAADYDGVVGNLALRRFRCTFDYERRVLHLEPGVLAEVPDPFTRVGLTFARRGDEVTVLSVMSGSPSDEAGVRSGDVVHSIDGQPASTWDPDRLRQWFEEPECREVDLLILCGGEERVVVVHAQQML